MKGHKILLINSMCIVILTMLTYNHKLLHFISMFLGYMYMLYLLGSLILSRKTVERINEIVNELKEATDDK